MINQLSNNFRFAYNPEGTNKDWDFKKLTEGYIDTEGSLDEVLLYVKEGYAICAGLLEGAKREKINFKGSNWIIGDVDNSIAVYDSSGKPVLDSNGKILKIYSEQLTIDQALAHPLIQDYCCLIYTSPSHTENWHKFRLIFRLPETVTDINLYEALVKKLMQELPLDPSCKDGVRAFYGNTNAEFPCYQPDKVVPLEWIDEAEGILVSERIEREWNEKQKEFYRSKYQDNDQDTDELVKQALKCIPARTPGSGTYQESRTVLMALASHYSASEAESIASSWSPSIPGTTWNIQRKIKSFKKSGIGLGSLFYIAQKYGFEFPETKEVTTIEPKKELKVEKLENKKETLLESMFDYMVEIKDPEYLEYDKEYFLTNVESNLTVVAKDIVTAFSEKNLNGHGKQGKELLLEYSNLTGEKLEIKEILTEELLKEQYLELLEQYTKDLISPLQWNEKRTSLKNKFIKARVASFGTIEEWFTTWEKHYKPQFENEGLSEELKLKYAEKAIKDAALDVPFELHCPKILELLKEAKLDWFFNYANKNEYPIEELIFSLLPTVLTSKKAYTQLKLPNGKSIAGSLLVALIAHPNVGKSEYVKPFLRHLEDETETNRLEWLSDTKNFTKELKKRERMEKDNIEYDPDEDLDLQKNKPKENYESLVINNGTSSGIMKALVHQEWTPIYGTDEMAESSAHLHIASNTSTVKVNMSIFRAFFDSAVYRELRKSAEEIRGRVDCNALIAFTTEQFPTFFNLATNGTGIESRYLMYLLKTRKMKPLQIKPMAELDQDYAERSENADYIKNDEDLFSDRIYKLCKLIKLFNTRTAFRIDAALENPHTVSWYNNYSIARYNDDDLRGTPKGTHIARLYYQHCPRIALALHLMCESLKGAYEIRNVPFDLINLNQVSGELPVKIADKYMEASLEFCRWYELQLEDLYKGKIELETLETAEVDTLEMEENAILRLAKKKEETGVIHTDFGNLAPFRNIKDGTRMQNVKEAMQRLITKGVAEYRTAGRTKRLFIK